MIQEDDRLAEIFKLKPEMARTMENNLNHFTRVEREEDSVTIVKQMPKVTGLVVLVGISAISERGKTENRKRHKNEKGKKVAQTMKRTVK